MDNLREDMTLEETSRTSQRFNSIVDLPSQLDCAEAGSEYYNPNGSLNCAWCCRRLSSSDQQNASGEGDDTLCGSSD